MRDSKVDSAVASQNRTQEVRAVFRWFILLDIMLLKMLATEDRKQRQRTLLQGICFTVREGGPEANVLERDIHVRLEVPLGRWAQREKGHLCLRTSSWRPQMPGHFTWSDGGSFPRETQESACAGAGEGGVAAVSRGLRPHEQWQNVWRAG